MITKKIKLTRGYEVEVSEQDYEYLMQWKWNATDCSRPWHNVKKIYASRATRKGGKYRKFYMHREIMERVLAEFGMNDIEIEDEMYGKVVDHGDGGGLNNTRENLWLVEKGDNSSSGMGPASASAAREMGESSREVESIYRELRKDGLSRRTAEEIAKDIASGKTEAQNE